MPAWLRLGRQCATAGRQKAFFFLSKNIIIKAKHTNSFFFVSSAASSAAIPTNKKGTWLRLGLRHFLGRWLPGSEQRNKRRGCFVEPQPGAGAAVNPIQGRRHMRRQHLETPTSCCWAAESAT